jgi:hypothetical protein
MKRILLAAVLIACGAVSAFGQYTGGTQTSQQASHFDAATNVQHTHTSAATVTITPPSGQFVFITAIDVQNCEGATTVAVANPTYITTTGITGSPQYQVASGPGTAPGVASPPMFLNFAPGALKSTTAGAVVTFVMPTFIANQTVSLNIYYYTSP